MATKRVNPQKAARVSHLKGLLDQAKSVAVVDYRGLNVTQATVLRTLVKAAGGEMKVEKNTLFRIALGSLSNQVTNNQLTGLSAFIFSLTDDISALKAVADFSTKTSLLSFKMGLWSDKILSADEALALAQTPAKETSLAKLVYLLNWNTSQLVRTLNEVKNKLDTSH